MRYHCALFVTLLAACGGETDGGSAPPAGEDRPLEADFEEVYRIGGIAAEGWDAFTEIADLDFDAGGRLYIRDEAGSSTRIVVVDGVGALAVEFGRMGDGPGELREVGHMVARPGGGVVIVDNGHRAYLLFGSDGSFARAIRFASTGASETAFPLRVHVARDGGALLLTRSPAASVSGGDVSVATGDRTIYRVPLDEAEEARRVPFAEGWEARPERRITMEGGDVSDMFGALGDAFAFFEPNLVFDVLPGGGVAYSDSSAYAVKIQPTAGAPAQIIGRPLQPEPVTEELRELVRARAVEAYESAVTGQVNGQTVGDDAPAAIRQQVAAMMEDLRAGLRDMVANASFMPEVPLVRDLRTTWEGMIWVERWGSDPLEQVELVGGVSADGGPEGEEAAAGWIDVLSPEGEYMGTLSLEEMPRPGAFGPGGLVAFVETDEFDVPTIIVKRVPETVRLELGSPVPGAAGGGR